MRSCIFEKNPHEQKLDSNKSRVLTLKSVRDLGINYARSLEFEEHASSIISKPRRLIGFIIKNFFTTEAKLKVYKISIRPFLKYCFFIFPNIMATENIRVHDFQRHFKRQLLRCESTIDYKDRCKHLSA